MVAGIPGDVACEIDQYNGLPGEVEVAATAQPGLTHRLSAMRRSIFLEALKNTTQYLTIQVSGVGIDNVLGSKLASGDDDG